MCQWLLRYCNEEKKSPALLAVHRTSAVRCYILYYEVYICKLSSNPGNVVL